MFLKNGTSYTALNSHQRGNLILNLVNGKNILIMKKRILTLIVISIMFSCTDEEKNNYFIDYPIGIEYKDDGIYEVNENTGEYLSYLKEYKNGNYTSGLIKNTEKNGIWKYYNEEKGVFDSIVLYTRGDSKGVLNIIYQNNYHELGDGWYLYSSRVPYRGLVPYFEYGYMKNGGKQGEWVEEITWNSFSNSKFTETHSGSYKNGMKEGVWNIKYHNILSDDLGKSYAYYEINYYKNYHEDKLLSFNGYLVKDSLQLNPLQFYSLDSCVTKVERYKNGLKEGKEEYFDCSIKEAFDNYLVIEKNYKEGKLNGKFSRYAIGKLIYEAEYKNDVKIRDTTLVN